MGTIRWQNVTLRAAAGARVDRAARPPASRARHAGPAATRSPSALAVHGRRGGRLRAADAGLESHLRTLARGVAGRARRSGGGHRISATSCGRRATACSPRRPMLYVGAIGLLLWSRRRPASSRCRRSRSFARDDVLQRVDPGLVGQRRVRHAALRRHAAAPRRRGPPLPLSACRAFVARAAAGGRGAAAAALVLWNLTFMDAALAGVLPDGESVVVRTSSAARAGRDARALVRPPVLVPGQPVFALRTGQPPSSYDVFWTGRFLADPARPYGRIDSAATDASGSATAGTRPEGAPTAPRSAGRRERARFVVRSTTPRTLRVLVRAMPFIVPGAAPQSLTLVVNGRLGHRGEARPGTGRPSERGPPASRGARA